MLDHDSAFDGKTSRSSPLGGTESAFIALAEAFADLGHEVIAMTKISKQIFFQNVSWNPISSKIKNCDLYIVNRAPELINNAPKDCKVILWLHNPAKYLNKFKNLRKLIFKDIIVVCTGQYHYESIPFWLKSRSIIIPLGIEEKLFSLNTLPSKPPKPEVIFTSNPERGLEWLVNIWMDKIIKSVPNAKLNIYAGSKTYGGRNNKTINNILNKIKKLNSNCISIYDPIEKIKLFKKIIKSRSMFYSGDEGETFCLSVAEAQALGLPCIVKPIGSLEERVKHKITGEVVNNDDEFVDAAINILTNDEEWTFYRNNCLKLQRNYRWNKIAEQYLKILN